MAPGVAILAATIPEREPGNVPIGMKPSQFGIKSGTSMACPHVTGAASLVMSVHRGWTPSMIKSALMTTGIFFNVGNLSRFSFAIIKLNIFGSIALIQVHN